MQIIQIQIYWIPNMVIKLTLQVAAVSELVGTDASAAKQVPTVLPEVQAVDDPHLQVADVQMLLNGAPHFAAVPHKQVPALHVSESPEQVITEQGSGKLNRK